MLISLRNIKKTYGKGDLETCAIRGINLDIDEGEMVAIMGPSGSGKSTLLNIIGCIDKASGGSYLFRDKDISDYDSKSLARIRNEEIGFVFQSFNLLEEYNLVENTILPLLYRKGSKRGSKLKGEEMLSKVELLEHKKKRPSQLSGGQQQRVAIARALVGQPSLILADEPTGALDQNTGKEIMKLLVEINNSGKTVIIVTHDEKVAAQCKRIIYLEDGQVKEN
jgi:putative ABC transport system ATP-binding protein